MGVFFYGSGDHRARHVLAHSFPTQRSSDQRKANAAVRSSTIGGASAAARIMNHVRGGADRRIIGELTGIDEDIGQTIQDQMFIFDNLLSLDDRSMQTLLRSVDNTLLVPAQIGRAHV